MRDKKVLLVGCIVGAVFVWIYYSAIFSLDWKVTDFKFKLLGEKKASPYIVVVKIDNNTVNHLGKWPVKKEYWALLVRILSEYDARAIAFALHFQDRDGFDSGYAILADEIKKAGNVFLPFFQVGENNCAFPVNEIKEVAAGVAFTNVEPDADGVLRNVKPFRTINGVRYPFFGISFFPHGFHGNRDLPDNLVFNLSRKREAFISYSLWEILESYRRANEGGEPAIPPSAFNNKYVIVGLTASGIADCIPTPAGTRTPDLFVYANTASDIASNNYYTRTGTGWALLLVFLMAFLPGVFLYYEPRLAGVLFSIGATVIVIAVDAILFASARVIFPIFSMFLASVAGLFACFVYTSITRERIFVSNLKKEYAIRDTLVEGINYGILLVGSDGIIEYRNRNFHKLLDVPDFSAKTGLAEAIAEIPAIVSAISNCVGAEFERNIDGEVDYFRLECFPIRPENSKEGLTLAVIQNVTESKQLQEKAKTNEQLAMVGEMSAGIAHEMRNPLGGMFMFLGLLEKELGRHDYIDRAKQEGQVLDGLVESFMQYAKPIFAEKKKVDVREIAEECRQLFSAQLEEKHIQVSVDSRDGDYGLFVDRTLFKQVLCNLFSNSIDAIKDNGRISIMLEMEIVRDRERRKFTFSDNGAGMSEEVLKKVFVPFYTTKTKGIGLGMPMVSKIVMAHDGNIGVESRKGEGSVITILFPEE